MTAPWQHRPGAGARAIHLADEAATARLGALLAAHLGAGDALLLSGPLGAGKSALARAVLRAWLGDPAREVPSPSYTLVNTHAAGAREAWHADLYRLSGPEEAAELGLEDRGPALLLVEWPDRLGESLPEPRVAVDLAPLPEAPDTARRAAVEAEGARWAALRRALEAAWG